MGNKVIVRADDLGYSEAVNYGIAKTVHNGLINNVGMMVNMPATQMGLDLIKDADVCLGLHVVISSGKPLTNPELIPSIVDQNGYFKSSKIYRSADEDFVDLEEVVVEIEAQYQKYIKLVGHKPGYFEGHAVASPNFIKGLEIVANRHGLEFLRFKLGPSGKSIPYHGKKLYVFMDSMQEDYDPYVTFKKMASFKAEDGYAVMVCHPGYLDDYILKHSTLTIPRTKEVTMLTDPAIQEWVNQNSIELITYEEV